MVQYHTLEELSSAIDKLLEANKPFRATFHDLASYSFDVFPISAGDTLWAVVVRDGEVFKAGQHLNIDLNDEFQDLTWEPIEIEGTEWHKYLPKKLAAELEQQ